MAALRSTYGPVAVSSSNTTAASMWCGAARSRSVSYGRLCGGGRRRKERDGRGAGSVTDRPASEIQVL